MKHLWTPEDGSITLWEENGKRWAEVHSKMGYPAMYPFYDVSVEKPVKAVLMDLDGTSIESEPFWVGIMESTIAHLTGNSHFSFEDADLPYVSGHSVSEHLQYCIRKYCPEKSVEDGRQIYYQITEYEMTKIMEGHGRKDAFVPMDGLKDFLVELKARKIRIGLVTSGLYQKAMPELLSAFQAMNLGDPREFYDTIITAGYALGPGRVGTLGELTPKPHPWLYAEAMRIGLGIPFEERCHVLGMEDSSAGVISIRLAGFAPIGVEGGNIRQAGDRKSVV